MLRLLGLACGGLSLLAAVSGCSSNSKPKNATTPLRVPATVFANGTVVVGGTPVTGQAAATIVAAATAGVPLTQNGNPNAARPGTPGATARTSVTAADTVVPGATPATDSTAVPVTVTASPVADSTAAAQATASAIANPPPTPANVPPADGFMLTVPLNPSGTFDVVANIVGSPSYSGFNVHLAFDASLLKVTGIDYGGAMGPSAQVFCAPGQISDGNAALGCARLGANLATNPGALAIFHFQVLKAGTTNLHFTTYAEGGGLGGTFLVGSANQPLTLPLHDATITVSP